MAIVEKESDRKVRANPLDFPDYTEAEVRALYAVNAGTASAHQQKLAVKFVIEVVCGTYDVLFRPDSRLNDLAQGKALVGQHMIWLIKNAPLKNTNREEG